MSRLAVALALAATAALLAAPGAGAAPALSPDRVIVQWAPGASPAERGAARADADVGHGGDLGSRRFQLVEVEPGQAPAAAVRELRADPAVATAERDAYLGTDAIPDDPFYGLLWGMPKINAPSAWDRTAGTPGTVVASIDSGYRFEHPDLAGVAWDNPAEAPNGADDDGNGIIDDLHGADFIGASAETPVTDGNPTDDDLDYGGHGVHTAGTIGAEGDNGIGVTGVAQDARIMPLRACGPVIGDAGCTTSAVVAAINYAGSHGARAANLSLGGEVFSAAIRDALAANPGTLYVISAGNDGVDNEVAPHYPCVYDPRAEGKSAIDNVICVAATDRTDKLASYSNWGLNTVDLGAPGSEILSTYPVTAVFRQDFELNDFASNWSSGPGGGFARSNEAPLTSYGITDSPGAAPVAGSARSSTFTMTMPAGFRDCVLEQNRTVRGSSGSLMYEVGLDGETLLGTSSRASGRIPYDFRSELSGGGELELTFTYNASANPAAGDGAWIEDVALHCTARIGEPGGYRYLNGTSMATPHVTGAAALLFSLKPAATVTEVRRGLLASVQPLASLAGKTTTGGRLDAAAAVDLFDGTAPPAPTLSTTSPAGPANENQPRLKGTAQRGTSVAVYAGDDCSGAPVATGTAAQLASPGIAVTVADNSFNLFTVKATDMVPLGSECSDPIAYTELTDEIAPDPPQLTASNPPSPGSSGTPRIIGSAEAGSMVRLYGGAGCSGELLATTAWALLESPGILVGAAEGTTETFSATATDAAGNTSACSAPFSYTRTKAVTESGGGGPVIIATPKQEGPDATPPAPGCRVPKLTGKTLAQAKAALRAASCRLGAVRKPKPRKGKRPALVVKSSNPAAGARAAGGKVGLTLGPKPRKARG